MEQPRIDDSERESPCDTAQVARLPVQNPRVALARRFPRGTTVCRHSHDQTHRRPAPMSAHTRSTTDNDLVKVAYACNQSEAEFLQGLLLYARRTSARSSVARRASTCRSSLPPVPATCSSRRPTYTSR